MPGKTLCGSSEKRPRTNNRKDSSSPRNRASCSLVTFRASTPSDVLFSRPFWWRCPEHRAGKFTLSASSAKSRVIKCADGSGASSYASRGPKSRGARLKLHHYPYYLTMLRGALRRVADIQRDASIFPSADALRHSAVAVQFKMMWRVFFAPEAFPESKQRLGRRKNATGSMKVPVMGWVLRRVSCLVHVPHPKHPELGLYFRSTNARTHAPRTE
jgi:hypothetical protein